VAAVSANPDAAIAAIAVLRIGCPLAIFTVRIKPPFSMTNKYRRTGRAVNFFLLDENPRMESDGKGHLRQQENCILRGEKSKFCGRNWTTHHFDAAANWIEGEFSSKFG
jgi:hypothetical protein